MNLLEMLSGAFGNSSAGAAEEQRAQGGLPPLTIQQQLQQIQGQTQGPVTQGMEQNSQFQVPPVAPGMFSRAMSGGLGPAPGGMPTVPGQGPMSGQIQGGSMIPRGPGMGQAGPKGNVYDGQVVGKGMVPSPQAGPAGAGRNTNNVGVRPDSGPIPMGGPPGSIPRPPGQPQENTGLMAGIQNAFGKLSGAEKAGVGLTGAAAAWSLPEVFSRIFGGDPVEGGTAQRLPLPDWAKGGKGGGGGGKNELPAAWRSQISQDVPGIDWENLPRPDYEQARAMLGELAPEAPEERNWLDRLPVNAKNMIGFGILLGPIGLLLGAGIGASANRSIDRAQADAHKQEAREYMREMIGFDLDWGKAERSMALEQQQGMRDEAMDNISLERQFQQWGMDDASWQDDMQTSALRRQQMMHSMQGGGGDTMGKLWQNALLQAPDQVMSMYEKLSQSIPYEMKSGSADQQKFMNEMIQANIVRALYQ